MKKALLTTMIMLLAFAFLVGCGNNAQSSNTPQYPDLPQLTVAQFHATFSRVLSPVQALQGAANWTWPCGRGIRTDFSHLLLLSPDAFDNATLVDHSIYLHFSYPPQEFTVRRWPAEFLLLLEQDENPFDSYEMVEITLANDEIPAFVQTTGDYIYEVQAQWANENKSSYSFRVTNFF